MPRNLDRQARQAASLHVRFCPECALDHQMVLILAVSYSGECWEPAADSDALTRSPLGLIGPPNAWGHDYHGGAWM